MEKPREGYSSNSKAKANAYAKCGAFQTVQYGLIRQYEVGSEGRLGWRDRLKSGQGRP